jgi:hypothetical protein
MAIGKRRTAGYVTRPLTYGKLYTLPMTYGKLYTLPSIALFIWLISNQITILFSENKSAINHQSEIFFSQNKSASPTSYQPNE